MIRKGILLAGGLGTRLYPLSLVASKHLQRVYDKPMIYHPLSTLLYAGVREICLVAPAEDLPAYRALFGDGERWGLAVEYRAQEKPLGVADALLKAADFARGQPLALILGDNLFHGSFDFSAVFASFTKGAHIFAQRVQNPERYGVVELDDLERPLSIEEKPRHPKSAYAVTGLYLYDASVLDICRSLTPSPRGELEITDVNREFLRRGTLSASLLGRGMTWLDMGTLESLDEASLYLRIVEERQGVKIGCPEELALRKGLIDLERFRELCRAAPPCAYRRYLENVAEELAGGPS